MKKLLSLALVAMLMLSCMIIPVSAEKSPELKDVISSVEGTQKEDEAKVEVSLTEMTKEDKTLTPKFGKDTVIAQRKVTISGDAKYPLTITAAVDGAKTTSFMYILAKAANGAVVRLNATIEKDGIVNFSFDKAYTAVSFINAGKEAVTEDKKPVEIKKEEIDHVIETTHKEEPVVIYVEKPAAVKIPAVSVNKVIGFEMTLTVKSDIVSATFDTKALTTMVEASKEAEEDTHIVIELVPTEEHHTTDAEKATIERLKPSLELTALVFVNDVRVADFKGGKVEVAIPFKPEAGYTLADYILVHIKDDGAIERIPTRAGVDQLLAELEHFSEYAVVRIADLEAADDTLVEPAESNNTLTIIIIAAAAVVLLAIIIILILLKKKKKDDKEEA